MCVDGRAAERFCSSRCQTAGNQVRRRMTPIEDSVEVPAARQWPGNSADDDLDKELRGADACESCAILSLRSGDFIISPFRGTYRSDDLACSIETTAQA